MPETKKGEEVIRMPLASADVTAEQRLSLHYPITDPATGNTFEPPLEKGWRYSRERMEAMSADGRVLLPSSPSGRSQQKKFHPELEHVFAAFPPVVGRVLAPHWTKEVRDILGFHALDSQELNQLIRGFLEQTSEKDFMAPDLFTGSETTGHVGLLELFDGKMIYL